MTSYFKKPVIICGLAIPVFIMVVIAVVVLAVSNNINKKLKISKVAYKKAQTEEKQVAKLQSEVGEGEIYLKRWDEGLTNETRGTFLGHWKEVGKNFPGKEFTRLPHNWINQSSGLGSGVNQPSSQVEMEFLATFRAMQLSLIEIESALPQMQLDSFSMVPDANGERLNFKTKFTVWTKN